MRRKQYVTEETVTALEELENRIQSWKMRKSRNRRVRDSRYRKIPPSGQGYLVEPVLVEISRRIHGADPDVALGENGLRHDNTGSGRQLLSFLDSG